MFAMKDKYATSDDGSHEHRDKTGGMNFRIPKVFFPRGTVPREVFHRPWYIDREYLLGGWTEARVWRAAVR